MASRVSYIKALASYSWHRGIADADGAATRLPTQTVAAVSAVTVIILSLLIVFLPVPEPLH
jgi:hypothetical protein